MSFFDRWVFLTGVAVMNTAWVCAILWGFERLFPKGSPRPRLRVLTYWVVSLAVTTAVTLSFGDLAAGADPLVLIPLREWFAAAPILRPLGWVLLPLAFLLLADFFYYWCHRIQHRWFWRFHSVHHAISDMSAVNSYHHWTEELFRTAMVTAPMTFVLGVGTGPAIPLAVAFLTMHGYFIHSATRLNFGPLRYVLADNRFHRIHHSVEERHFDKNFGSATSIWDLIFGTAHMPSRDEWPDTGLADRPEVETFADYMLRPFRRPPASTDDAKAARSYTGG